MTAAIVAAVTIFRYGSVRKRVVVVHKTIRDRGAAMTMPLLVKYATASAIILASSCGNQTPPVNAISYGLIQKVEGEVKRQLGVYQGRANYARQNPADDAAFQAANAAGFVCGKGLIDFDISSVTLDLTVTTDSTGSGSLGFTIPIVGPTGTVGPSASASREVNDTQELSIPLYPVLNSKFVETGATTRPAPIADALFALRAALIQGGTTDGICVYDYDYKDPKSDPGGTFKLGLVITGDAKAGIDLKLSVVDLGANAERKSITGNSIQVTFHQHGLPAEPLPLDPKTGIPKPGPGSSVGEAAPVPHQ